MNQERLFCLVLPMGKRAVHPIGRCKWDIVYGKCTICIWRIMIEWCYKWWYPINVNVTVVKSKIVHFITYLQAPRFPLEQNMSVICYINALYNNLIKEWNHFCPHRNTMSLQYYICHCRTFFSLYESDLQVLTISTCFVNNSNAL